MSAPAARLRAGVGAAGLIGAGLVVIYTGLISSADAITKLVAGQYAAPQLYAISGLVVLILCVGAGGRQTAQRTLRTACPRAMALRSLATVLAALCFFYAFRLLPFVDVFLFIGLMPLLAGLMSGPILGEPVRPAAWLALIAGCVGVLFLFPGGLATIGTGHLFALGAAVTGTFSMVLARYIGRIEDNALAQVFFPNLAICVSMGLMLPFVWQPMAALDLGWVLAYAVLLFGARWVLVVALRLLPAYTVTPLMNLQFVWMVVLGALAFGEWPQVNTLWGVAIIIGSGLYLIWDRELGSDTPLSTPRRAG